MTRNLNLVLMVFWLLLAVAVFARRYWFPADLDAIDGDPTRTSLMGVLALGLALWNFLRWFSAWSDARTKRWERDEEDRRLLARREAERERAAGGEKPVVNPELRFDDGPGEGRV